MTFAEGSALPIARRLSKKKVNILPTICLVFLALVVVTGIASPWLAPYDEGAIVTQPFVEPQAAFWLGSDFLGRDVLSRIMFGLRVTIGVGFGITIIGFIIGSAGGFLSAAIGGKFDYLVSRLVDALISFPSMMIALVVVASLGSSIPVLIITVGIIDATRVYRVARSLGVGIVVQDYVEVAQLRGERLPWIIFHEVLPNTVSPLLAEFGIRFTYAILFISALSFLGLGVQPPHSDLGLMVKENMQALLLKGYTPIYPAIVIGLITISVNLIVDQYSASRNRVRR